MKSLQLAVTTTALAALVSGAALAQDKSAPPKGEQEKCYGVAQAGKNDCASGPGTSCAGTSKVDYHGSDWKFVAKGTCTNLKTPKGKGALTPIKS